MNEYVFNVNIEGVVCGTVIMSGKSKEEAYVKAKNHVSKGLVSCMSGLDLSYNVELN